MTTTNDDLWPEDLGSDAALDDSPLVFLRKQATALGGRTKNIVEAEVSSEVDQDLSSRFMADLMEKLSVGQKHVTSTDYVVYRFTLKAPALGDYRYVLFRAYQPVENFYPLIVHHEGALTRIDSEKDFTECLRRIFSADSTRRVIATLRAQSRK